MSAKPNLFPSIWFFLCLTQLGACSGPDDTSPVPASSPTMADSGAAPSGQLGIDIVPGRYAIELSIDPSRDAFSGKVTIDLTLSEPRDAIWLHGKDLRVSEVYLSDRVDNRVDASYAEKTDSGVALVKLSRTVAAGPAKLHFSYTADFNRSANALFKVRRAGNDYAVTQFEPIAARQVFPGFDEPGFKVPFDLAVIARKDDVVVTNTPEASAEDYGDGMVRHVFERTRPLPTYLLAFAVGPYDVVDGGSIPANAVRDRVVPLRGIAAKGLGEKMQYALQHTDGLLSELENYFGTPYPYKKLDLIAMPESFGGAMENAGAITYDEYLLMMDENSPLNQRRAYTSTHAHEMGHMWFGDLVTPKWWTDIWLNESFASWIEYKVAEAYWPEGEFDRETLKGALGAMGNDSLAAAREIREPIVRNEQISSAFDGITYQKGAGVLAMLERYVGEDRFRDGIRLHMQRHEDGTATAEDFIESVAEGSDRLEIEAVFKSFIEQPGVPLLTVQLDCKDAIHPRLNFSQARYSPLGSAIRPEAGKWDIPVCVDYMTSEGRSSTCALIKERTQSVSLDLNACPTELFPNADGTGYYRFAVDAPGWRELIAGTKRRNAAEALVLADSLDAAYRTGTVPAETYVSGMAALANHQAWDVADAATGYIEAITGILDADQLPRVEPAMRAMVAPRFASLANKMDAGSQLLRQRLQRFLIVIAKDQSMRKPLAARAAKIIGLQGEADPSAAPASEYETILSVGVQDIGEPFFDLLLQRVVESDDPQFRNAAIGALARVEDPAVVKKLQNAVLAGTFKGTEALGVLFRQMVRKATTELTYAWLKENDRVIIAMIPETFRSNVVPTFGSAFCTNERADDWQAFIEAHADELPGYERDLAQTLESIHLCAALKKAGDTQLISAFEQVR